MNLVTEPGMNLSLWTWRGNESDGCWWRKKRMMGGSVMRRSRRKHWRQSPLSPGTQAAGGERGVGGFSRPISEARGTSTLDLSLRMRGEERPKYVKFCPRFYFNTQKNICIKSWVMISCIPEKSEMVPSESTLRFSELSAVPIEASDSRVSSSDARGSRVSISKVNSSLKRQNFTRLTHDISTQDEPLLT